MSRRTSRAHAFAIVFGASFFSGFPDYGLDDVSEAARLYFDTQSEEGRPVDGESAGFIMREVTGVWSHADKIDALIDRFASGWSIERISRVDLAILRIAIHEMLYMKDIPEGVAINEAVELAKQYGQDDSPAFVNGILGSVSKDVKARRERGPRAKGLRPKAAPAKRVRRRPGGVPLRENGGE